MVKTFKDAEIQIQLLKREVEILRQDVMRLKTASASRNGNSINLTVPVNAIDSELTSDGQTIIHKLLHIFNNLNAKELEADSIVVDVLNLKKIDLRADTGYNWQVHIGEGPSDDGFYIANFALGTTILSTGARMVAGNWVALRASASIFELHESKIQIFFNSGLTVGANFSPTKVFDIVSNGNLTTTGNVNCSSVAGTGQVFAPVISGNTYYVQGSVGINSGVINTVSVVAHTTATIQYKDHANVNQVMNVVTSITPTNRADNYVSGIKIL